MNSISLEERICDLPQELHDIILAFVLKVDTDQIITIDPNYQPPVQLQIDSCSTKAASDIYYSSNIFVIPQTSKELRSETLCKWLTSLSEEHVNNIKEIRVPFYDVEEAALRKREGLSDPRQLNRRGLILRMIGRLQYLEFKANFHGVQKRWAKDVILKTDWKFGRRRETKWFTQEELANLPNSPHWRVIRW